MSKQGQLQYTFLNSLESNHINQLNSIFIMKLRPHGGILFGHWLWNWSICPRKTMLESSWMADNWELRNQTKMRASLISTSWCLKLKFLSNTALKVPFYRKIDRAQKNMPNHYLKLEFLKLNFVCFCFAADFQANPTVEQKAGKFKQWV